MSQWNFAQAEDGISSALAVLATRDEITAAVAPIGLVVPADLRTEYETSSEGLTAAQSRADVELAAARALVAADAEVHAPRDAMTSIGLIGQAPDAELSAARTAFEAGAADAGSRAEALTAMIGDAAAIGQTRVAVGIAVVLVLLFLAILAAVVVRRRRRDSQRMALADARRSAPAAPPAEATGSYATLPDQSTGAGPSPERPPADPRPGATTEPSTDPAGGGPERGTAP